MRFLSRTEAAVILAFFVQSATPQDRLAPQKGGATLRFDPAAFQVAEGPKDGPAVYYQVIDEAATPLLRGEYQPGMETVTMGVEVPEAIRSRVKRIRWKWRVGAFPTGGDECTPGKGDSAASVSLAFKRGLKWYVIRYVWSTESPLGAVCDSKRSLLLNRDTIVLASGGKSGVWLSELVDVRKSFVDRFAGGDPSAEVPDLVGIGLLTDGDQTNSRSAADWAAIELLYDP